MKNGVGPNGAAEWSELKEIWRTGPEIDGAELAAKARRAGFWMRLTFVFETVLAAAGVAAGVYLIQRGDTASFFFGLFVTAFSAGALFATTWVRRGVWGAESRTTEALLDLQIRRARAAIRYAQWNINLCPVALLFIPFGLWMLGDARSANPWSVAWIFGFTLLWTGALACFFAWYKKRKRRELANLTALAESMTRPE